MAPRSKQCTKRAPSTEELAEKAKISGWERSKLSTQDNKMLKKMGLLNKGVMKMPGDESSPHPPIGFRVTFVDFLIRGISVPLHEFLRGLLFIYRIQLHQLNPNSLLHISIFITLCECFLGIHPHWGLWKRIFYLRRNNLKNVIYNVGGVCICVRPEVRYFDVKFTDSVQGWRRKWLYIKDESSDAQEYGLAPFDAAEDIQRRKSWDAEASAEEKAATDALIARIQELQNTDGAQLSGVQIIAHFLRIRVQPLQARKRPRWMYSGAEDTDRVSEDLPLKDLEKLVRHFTSLSKNHQVPSSCHVEPFSGSHALPENHQSPTSLPPLPEGGEVDERAVVTDDSADEEEEEPESHGPAPTSTSNTLVLSEDRRVASEASPPPQVDPEASTPVPSPRAPKPKNAKTGAAGKQELATGNMPAPILDDPLMKELVNLGSLFTGFHDEAATLREALRCAKERTADQEAKLKASEEARKRAEKDAAGVEDLRQRLQAAEDALSDKEAKQVERENDIVTRLETQSRRFSRKMGEQYTLSKESDDRLLDTLDILELNCDLARKCITSVWTALKRVFPHFFPKDTQPEIFAQLA
ncbi:hypothetical protein QYE76_007088 [Lolium multiflorum]|uniref:Transposase (putative) gypsy type domain-containing protein n=1 Tax=Lolium multiflorum TaxID=4521 RepID=A0AAD8RW06_LOLMU|nr:hypothetical protein QYE76_007088 [Lolium multiflorum]